MNIDEIRIVLSIYRQKLDELGIPKQKAQHDFFPSSNSEYLAHCHAMLDDMETFLEEGNMDKLFRWLGFIQACLWRAKIFTIEELKKHNRP